MSGDEIAERLSVEYVINMNAKIVENRAKRATLHFPSGGAAKEYSGNSYIFQVGKKHASKNIPVKQVATWIQQLPKNADIILIHSTRNCHHCGNAAWNFIDFERRGHSTCPRCGTEHRLKQNNFSLRLNDDGQANKTQWEHTPGMSHRDCELRNKKGKRFEIGGQKPKSHLRNYWRIRKKIDGISQFWHFMAIESIIRRAKTILKKFYYTIHDDTTRVTDDSYKLPHGGAALAGSCFYVAVLEFESRVGFKTQCTLPAIQEQAQSERDLKKGRRCRDVTDRIILRYASRIKKCGLTSVKIPQIGAETLHFHPKSAAIEHARMALFNECNPVRFHLPSTQGWGIKVGNTKKGVLYIEDCRPGGNAWKQGIRKDDYIFQVDKETIGIDFTPVKFEKYIGNLRKKSTDKPVIEFMIMRKNKN
jgi:predicted Zn-ribbon and HTH transcriptional regulator